MKQNGNIFSNFLGVTTVSKYDNRDVSESSSNKFQLDERHSILYALIACVNNVFFAWGFTLGIFFEWVKLNLFSQEVLGTANSPLITHVKSQNFLSSVVRLTCRLP